MNKVIKDLAEQAGICHHGDIIDCSCNSIEYPEFEKFVLMIINVCVKVCNNRVGGSDYNTGRMHCASDIKDRFGVK